MTGRPGISRGRSPCTVNQRWIGAIAIVTCAGDLDMVTAPMLERHIDDVLLHNPAVIVVDLTAVDFLASHGMSVLAGAHSCLRGKIELAVVADGRATSRPITLIGLDTLFPIHSTLDAALAAFENSAHA